MWREHSASYASRHKAGLRLLARIGRIAVHLIFGRPRDAEHCGVAGSVAVLRISR
jgi:hypothetical protein